MDSMTVILLYVFLWLIETFICIILLVRCLRSGRKFERELEQRYPEVAAKRKKYFLWVLTLPSFPVLSTPLENDMIDKELVALKRKAMFSFIGIFLSFGIFLIFSLLLHLISD